MPSGAVERPAVTPECPETPGRRLARPLPPESWHRGARLRHRTAESTLRVPGGSLGRASTPGRTGVPSGPSRSPSGELPGDPAPRGPLTPASWLTDVTLRPCRHWGGRCPWGGCRWEGTGAPVSEDGLPAGACAGPVSGPQGPDPPEGSPQAPRARLLTRESRGRGSRRAGSALLKAPLRPPGHQPRHRPFSPSLASSGAPLLLTSPAGRERHMSLSSSCILTVFSRET